MLLDRSGPGPRLRVNRGTALTLRQDELAGESVGIDKVGDEKAVLLCLSTYSPITLVDCLHSSSSSLYPTATRLRVFQRGYDNGPGGVNRTLKVNYFRRCPFFLRSQEYITHSEYRPLSVYPINIFPRGTVTITNNGKAKANSNSYSTTPGAITGLDY